jgi:replicative DNA helicase
VSAQAQALSDERLLLSVALQDPVKALDVLALVPPDDLELGHHRELMRYLTQRVQRGQSLGLVEVMADGHGMMQRFGGAGYVADLSDYAPSTSLDLRALGQRIRARKQLRQLGSIGHTLVRASQGEQVAYDGDALPDEPDGIASVLALELARVAEPPVRVEWTLAQALDDAVWDRVVAREEGRPPTVATQIRDLDLMLDGGLRRGELVIVAGRPGAGKTAFALGVGVDAASKGSRVGVISLEMSATELGDRQLARMSRCPLGKIRRGEVDQDDRIRDWRDAMAEWPMRIAAPSSTTPEGIVTQARRWAARGLDLLVIDYLQLVRHSRAERHDLAVGGTATLCKQLARDLGIPVVLLSQLNREVEKRATPQRKRLDQQREAWWTEVELPRLSDLRDSGQIEQDADVVLFPVRAEQFGVDSPSAAAVIVAKNRNGAVGPVPLTWHGPTVSYGGS